MPWLLDAFELFMLNVSCNSHCFLALCCALHRITSRVIHRTELFFVCVSFRFDSYSMTNNNDLLEWKGLKQVTAWEMQWLASYIMVRHSQHAHAQRDTHAWDCAKLEVVHDWKQSRNGNDPYAGSPTNTLLRLLLPLNDQVWPPSRLRVKVAPNTQQSRGLTKPFNR